MSQPKFSAKTRGEIHLEKEGGSYHGKQWYITVYQGRLRFSTVYNERGTVYHGIPRYNMVHHGMPWYTMVYHSIPWYTMVYHGILAWYTMVPRAAVLFIFALPLIPRGHAVAPRCTAGPRYSTAVGLDLCFAILK